MSERKDPTAVQATVHATVHATPRSGRRAFLGAAAVAPVAALATISATLPMTACEVSMSGRAGAVSPTSPTAVADPAGPSEAVAAVRRFSLARDVEPAIAFRPLIPVARARDL